MARLRSDWSLNLCFSRASEALESNYLTKTSLSVYRDLATISRSFLVSALNSRVSPEEKRYWGLARKGRAMTDLIEQTLVGLIRRADRPIALRELVNIIMIYYC